MFCAKCGKELKEGWTVCPNCGEQVQQSNTESQVEQDTSKKKTKKEKKEQKKAEKAEQKKTEKKKVEKSGKGKKKFIIIGVIVVVIIIIIAVAAASSGGSGKATVDENTPVISMEKAGGYAQWEEDGYPGKVRTTIFVQLPVTPREANTYMVQLDDVAGTQIILMSKDDTLSTEWDWLQNAQPYMEGDETDFFNVTLSYTGMEDEGYPMFFFEDVERFSGYDNLMNGIDTGETDTGKTEANGTDLSGIDAETLVGKSIDEVEKTVGLKYDEDTMGISTDEVIVDFDMNDCVNMISIDASSGNAELAPSFHGITLGMGKDEAIEKISDKYDVLQNDSGVGFSCRNASTNGTITCQCDENDQVYSIIYMVASDEELEDWQ